MAQSQQQHERSAYNPAQTSAQGARQQRPHGASRYGGQVVLQDMGSVPLSRQSVFVPASPIAETDLELAPESTFDASVESRTSSRAGLGSILSALQKPLQPDQVSAPDKGPRRSRAHRPQLLWKLSEASRPRTERDLVSDFNARDFEDVPLSGMGPSSASAARVPPPPPMPTARQARDEVQFVLDEEDEAGTSASADRPRALSRTSEGSKAATREAAVDNLQSSIKSDGYEQAARSDYNPVSAPHYSSREEGSGSTRAEHRRSMTADEYGESQDADVDLEAQPLHARELHGYSSIDKASTYTPPFEPIVRRERAWMILSSLLVASLTCVSIAMAVDVISMSH